VTVTVVVVGVGVIVVEVVDGDDANVKTECRDDDDVGPLSNDVAADNGKGGNRALGRNSDGDNDDDGDALV
jgi:hypothetical protein